MDQRMEEDMELTYIASRSNKTPRSPISTPTQKRTRTNSDEETPTKSISNLITMEAIKTLILEMGKEISTNIKTELNMNNKSMTTSLINNIKTLQDTMNSNNKKLESEISSINSNITTLSTQFSALENDLKDAKVKVESVESTANNALNQVVKCQQHIENKLKQLRLESTMEIKGIMANDFIAQPDHKQLALQIIRSFSIDISDDCIEKVKCFDIPHKTQNSLKDKILQVKFKDFEEKLNIMKAKNRIPDNRGIFFNMSLTKINRRLMSEARKICKNKGFKINLNEGTSRAIAKDGKIFMLRDDDDLEKLRTFVATIATQSSSNSTA
ncbi:hypothetical protein PVAND_005113 [Polypedilum vanderplanki]|uniref:Uncharacterized protein n=1 Tax=Polypedilum vanderplanki TaxID=319348 RepID=A0A9J6C029_POLVA|nr:hypothetical protein PVAND_005113 [Polypedilum vanderplanki]